MGTFDLNQIEDLNFTKSFTSSSVLNFSEIKTWFMSNRLSKNYMIHQPYNRILWKYSDLQTAEATLISISHMLQLMIKLQVSIMLRL